MLHVCITSNAALAVLLVLAPAAGLAQDRPHAACAAPPSYVPTELLERPVALRTGIGNSHEAVTTASPEAQRFHDQGLNYLESYVWIEAARSFRQALRHDPSLALAYLGLSRVHSGLENASLARRCVDLARDHVSGITDRERRRIEIRDLQLAAMEVLADVTRQNAYKRAIDTALAADLDDVQLCLVSLHLRSGVTRI